MNNFFKHTLETHTPQSMSKITSYIREDIKNSNIENGIVVVYCPHTTAGITINENADPEKVYPTNDHKYRHFEGNSHSHLKSSTVGVSQQLILHRGRLILGQWQDVYFCDFDGPRNRTFYVKILEG